jgi:hypothetical protein
MVIVKGLAVHLRVPLNHDVAWLLIAAGRMLAHGSYSKDFFEINMPLAIGIYIPPHFLAHWFEQSIATANLEWTFILIIQSASLGTLLMPVDRKVHGIRLDGLDTVQPDFPARLRFRPEGASGCRPHPAVPHAVG